MNNPIPLTTQEVLHLLALSGFKDCTSEVQPLCERPCLYVFEPPGDDPDRYYGCETEEDLFTLLSLAEAALD